MIGLKLPWSGDKVYPSFGRTNVLQRKMRWDQKDILEILDTDVDLDTFELTEIQFAHQTITIPAGLDHYEGQIPFDAEGTEIFSTGTRDESNFIVPGTFLFKAEPVDQYGNLIDRHNLWEMVGVRYRRALFPGYSDTVEYMVDCPSALAPLSEEERAAWQNQGFDVPVPAGEGARVGGCPPRALPKLRQRSSARRFPGSLPEVADGS